MVLWTQINIHYKELSRSALKQHIQPKQDAVDPMQHVTHRNVPESDQPKSDSLSYTDLCYHHFSTKHN